MSWINEVVNTYQESESPEKYFYWSAISAISAVMKKQVYLERYTYRLYPNVYIFLVGRSGIKKSTPINLAKDLVEKTESTRIIFGRNSIQNVIKELGKAYTQNGGPMINTAQAYLISGELAAFLVKDPDALTILTDLHDTHSYEKEWKNSLKVSGVDVLKSPCLSLLGATNEDHFQDAVPNNAIGGGFIARTFIVYTNEKGKLNSLTQAPATVPNKDYLARYLTKLSKISGQFKWTEKGIKMYDDWYYTFNAQHHHDPTGTMGRIGDQILKLAMILSLSEDTSLELRQEHIFEAITSATSCLSGMTMVTMGRGKSDIGDKIKIVFRELLQSPDNRVSRQKLLQKYWGDMDHFELDRVIETLIGAGVIRVGGGRKIEYILETNAKEMFEHFNKKIM